MKLRSGPEDQFFEDLINEHLQILERYASQKLRQLFNNGIKNISKSEIVSIGYEGLYKAALKFDKTQNDNFYGYAWYYVDLAFKSYQRNIDEIHHVTRKQIKIIKNAMDLLSQKLERQPTENEIADHLKMDIKQIRKYRNIELNHIQSVQDTDEPFESVDEENQVDVYLEEREKESNLGRDMNECLESALSADQKSVIELMYLEHLNAEEIALKIWGKFSDKEKFMIYNSTKSGKQKLKKCMEKKGWSLTDI